MGAFTSQLAWTASGKLQTGTVNDESFALFLDRLRETVTSHQDAAGVPFQRALQWPTHARPGMFRDAAGFVIGTGDEAEQVSSSETFQPDNGGLPRPLLLLQRCGGSGDEWMVHVSTLAVLVELFDLLPQAMHRADLASMFENNRSPLENITGLRVAPERMVVELTDQMNELYSKLLDANAEVDVADRKRAARLKELCRLTATVSGMDSHLLNATLHAAKKHGASAVDMVTVEREVELLQSFCGLTDTACLQSVRWDSAHCFANNMRVPPWRELHGELAHVHINTVDAGAITATASKEGWFRIAGLAEGSDRLDYTKQGNVYPSLSDLLENHSPHFKANIEKQDFSKVPLHRIQDSYAAGPGSRNDVPSSASMARIMNQSIVQQSGGRKKASSKTSREDDRDARRIARGNDDVGQGPSLKWKHLDKEMTMTHNDEEGKEEIQDTYAEKDSQVRRSRKKKRKHPRAIATDTALPTLKLMTPKPAAANAPGDGASDERSRSGRRGDGNKPADVSDEESGGEGSDDEEKYQPAKNQNNDFTSDYWQMQKLVRFLKGGNQTATLIAMSALLDFDLSNEMNQLVIRDTGGLEPLINLTEADEPKLRMGAAHILKEITLHPQIQMNIANLDGIEPLIAMLDDDNDMLLCLAAETLAHCAQYSQNRRTIRLCGGVELLVGLLREKTRGDAVRASAAHALWGLSKSDKNKVALRQANAMEPLAALMESSNEELVLPVLGIINQCSSRSSFRRDMIQAGVMPHLIRHLGAANDSVLAQCTQGIFKLLQLPESQDSMRTYNGLGPLVNLLDRASREDADPELAYGVTGALWKSAEQSDNIATFNSLDLPRKMTQLLAEVKNEDIQFNVCGCLAACANVNADARRAIRKAGGIERLIQLLQTTNRSLQLNSAKAVGACANDQENLKAIIQLDGIRLLWSLLKSSDPRVQEAAAWAICPCIENAPKEAPAIVRSFVGGLELVVRLLTSSNLHVRVAVCAAISRIACDEENLGVMTDHGVIPLLSRMISTTHGEMKKHVANAIALCCHFGNNRSEFGHIGAVTPLVDYLSASSVDVHRATAKALFQLSKDVHNSAMLRGAGAINKLLGMVGSDDPELQEAAAGAISNIRRSQLGSIA